MVLELMVVCVFLSEILTTPRVTPSVCPFLCSVKCPSDILESYDFPPLCLSFQCRVLMKCYDAAPETLYMILMWAVRRVAYLYLDP